MPKRNDGNESAVRINSTAQIIVPSGGVFPPTANTTPPSQVEIAPSGPVSTPVDPQATALTYAWWDLTGLCPNGLDPRSVERIIMKLLVSHFSNPANISSQSLIAAGCVFNENPNVSGIRIVPFSIWDAATGNRKPSLVIKRGQLAAERIAVGDRTVHSGDSPSDRYAFTRLIRGEHIIVCGSQMNGEIDELAVEAFTALMGMSPAVRMLLPFQDFSVSAMSGVELADDLGNAYSTSIKIEYAYELGWTVSPPVVYTLTYNGNANTGGTAPVDLFSPYQAGSPAVAKPAGSLVKAGSTFGGWNTAADGSGTTYAVGASIPITSDRILYARWI